MSIPRPRSWCRMLAAVLAGAGWFAVPADAQDAAGLGTRPGRRPVKLWPPVTSQGAGEGIGRSLDLGGWNYRAEKSPDPRDGVPWELIVTPVGKNAEIWRENSERWRKLPTPGAAPAITATVRKTEDSTGQDPAILTVPVIIMPQSVWQAQMAAELHNAVGIHFHEFVTDDVARILYTTHKVPPDAPDGRPAGDYRGRAGTRLEATLLAPVVFSLDQTITIRKDSLDAPEQLDGRRKHEFGHALVSQDVFLDVLRGPQDWNTYDCTGRRSRIVFYWRRERIGRSWDGYRDQVGKLLTLRTSVALVPPTRWSMLLPIPPERVTQQQIQAFNDAIVHAAVRFNAADREAQQQYHAIHGAYD